MEEGKSDKERLLALRSASVIIDLLWSARGTNLSELTSIEVPGEDLRCSPDIRSWERLQLGVWLVQQEAGVRVGGTLDFNRPSKNAVLSLKIVNPYAFTAKAIKLADEIREQKQRLTERQPISSHKSVVREVVHFNEEEQLVIPTASGEVKIPFVVSPNGGNDMAIILRAMVKYWLRHKQSTDSGMSSVIVPKSYLQKEIPPKSGRKNRWYRDTINNLKRFKLAKYSDVIDIQSEQQESWRLTMIDVSA